MTDTQPPPVEEDRETVDATEPVDDGEPAADLEPGDSGDEAAGGDATGSRWRGPRPLVVACAMLLVLATGLGVVAAGQSSRLESEREDRRELRAVSGRLAEALLTYDFTDLDRSRQAVLRESTGKFRSEYERAFSSLETLLKAAEARSTATVTDVYLGPIDDGTATSIVVVDAVGQGLDGPRPVSATYIQLDLVKVEGQWKVDGVTYVRNLAPDLGTPGPTTSLPQPAE